MTAFDPYKVLRVRASATPERIKQSFRARSKATHPDVGGDRDAFMAVRRAYFILSDQARRRKYDRDGTLDEQTDVSFHSQVAAYQAQLFEVLLQQDGAFRRDVDLIQAMVKATRKEIDGRDEQRASGREYLKRLRVMQGRIKRADDSNLFVAILDRKCEQTTGKLTELEARIRVMRAALSELESYTCVTEMARQVGFFHVQASSSTTTSV